MQEVDGTATVHRSGLDCHHRLLDRRHGRLERIVDSIHCDAHLQREGPTGQIVWRIRRSTGIHPAVGILLRLHEIHEVRPERLGSESDVTPGRVLFAAGPEGPGRSVYANGAPTQHVHQLPSLSTVPLLGGDHIRERFSGPPFFDGSLTHEIDVVEPVLPEIGADLCDGHRSGHHVVHGVADAPPTTFPGIGVEHTGTLPGHSFPEVCWKLVGLVKMRRGVSVEVGLGEDADLVVEIRCGPHPAVPPHRIADPGDGTRFAFLRKSQSHRRAHQIDSPHHEWGNVGVHGIFEGRDEDARRNGTGLMVVVDDLRKPLVPQLVGHRPRFGL